MRVVWTIADCYRVGERGLVATFFEEPDAVTFAREQNARPWPAPRFQVERSLVVGGRTV